MSASLVGSEMCIRDRSLRGGRATPSPSCHSAPIAPMSDGGEGLTEAAVSYTHLTLPTICSV
eukprot:1691878-Alexandrium_andersonii.AAC.1